MRLWQFQQCHLLTGAAVAIDPADDWHGRRPCDDPDANGVSQLGVGKRSLFGDGGARIVGVLWREAAATAIGLVLPFTASFDIELAPSGNMGCHQRFKQPAVCRDSEMQQFVGDHKILKTSLLFDQVLSEGDDAGRRTGAPFPRHPLNTNDPGLDP
jgi:hypothetical protein